MNLSCGVFVPCHGGCTGAGRSTAGLVVAGLAAALVRDGGLLMGFTVHPP